QAEHERVDDLALFAEQVRPGAYAMHEQGAENDRVWWRSRYSERQRRDEAAANRRIIGRLTGKDTVRLTVAEALRSFRSAPRLGISDGRRDRPAGRRRNTDSRSDDRAAYQVPPTLPRQAGRLTYAEAAQAGRHFQKSIGFRDQIDKYWY